MLNLTANRKKIIGAIFFSIFIGMFVSKLLPAVTSNILFVFLIPVIGLFFILMTTNVKASIIFLLFLRCASRK